MPAEQKEHFVEPEDKLCWPSPHAEHCKIDDAPSVELKVPGGHPRHPVGSDAPTPPIAYLPAAHWVQEVRPSISLYVPAAQDVHSADDATAVN